MACIDIQENICIFCLVGMDESEKNTNIFGCDCNVYYHKECVDLWIKKSNRVTCPICKTPKIEYQSRGEVIYARIREEVKTIMILVLLFSIALVFGTIVYMINSI